MTIIFSESPQDWINAKPGKIYYNSKTKLYTSTVVTEQQTIPEENLKKDSEKYYLDFVVDILRNLNKSEDEVNLLLGSVKILGNYIDPSPLIKEKLLLGISQNSFIDIEEKPDIDITDFITNIYKTDDFFKRINNIAAKFEDYQTQYISNIFTNSTNTFSNVDFIMESEGLYTLKTNINDLIDSNSANISAYNEIQISFNAGSQIEKICLIDGIDSLNLKYLFENFKNEYPQNRPQTINFLLRLFELEQDIKSNSQNYETIVENYFFNSIKNSTRPTNIISRSSNRGISAASKNKDSNKDFAAVKEISNRSIKLLQREMLNSVYRTPCITPKEKDRIEKKFKEEKEKKANFANKLSISVSDAFFANLPEVLKKVADKQGDEALKSLGKNFLNRLGVCGIGDLTSLVTNTVFAYMNEQEYADELSRCAVKNLDNDKVSKLWAEVAKFGKNTEILEKYRKFVGDTIPPWQTNGYTPPDYRKDLNTDTFAAQYTLKIKTPIEDTDIDFRFNSFKDSISVGVRGEDLLDVLVNTFPDEMGWLNFFTDMTKGILNKCKVPMPNVGVSQKGNWCQKRVQLPQVEDVPKSNASFTFKPSDIGTILVEELKNLIINLTVKAIISSMKQIFQIISAGLSFDGDYFKQNQYIPDLFQNENAMQSEISNYCDETSNNYTVVNRTVKNIFEDKYPNTAINNPLSLQNIDSFLKTCSRGLGHYDKIRLYKGEGADTTYDKVLSLISEETISIYLQNYGDVEQIFLGIGQILDINKIENSFYQGIQNPSPSSAEYCGETFDYIQHGYLLNKPEMTEEQIKKMKNVLKDIQKDKICFAVETVGNPNGALMGQIGEMFKSKTGPIFGRIAEEMGKLFEPVIENNIKVISKNYQNDLYSSQGLLDLILVNNIGNGRTKQQLSTYFTGAELTEDLNALGNSKIITGSLTYSPLKSNTNISSKFKGDTSFRYRESTNNITIAGTAISPKIKTLKYEGQFESGANQIKNLLLKNQDILRESLKNEVSENFIINGQLTNIINDYFKNIADKLLAGPRTYIGNWQTLYKSIQLKIPDLLGEEKTIDDTKKLYGLLPEFAEKYKYVPFNPLKSKEEAAISYATFIMLVNVVTSEILLKTLPVYEAFGAEMLEDYEMMGEYIYRKFENTIDDYSNDRRRIKVLEKLVQITLLASNADLLPPLTNNLAINIENINTNIRAWVKDSGGTRVNNLEENEKDIENIARFFVKNISKSYIKEFQKSMSKIESKTLPSINKTNSISNYIFKESNLAPITNVVSDVNNVGILDKKLKFEKYIKLGRPTGGVPSGVQNIEDFANYLLINPLSGNISDHWESWSYGLRISSVFDFDIAGISSKDITLRDREQMKGFYLESNSDDSESEKYFLSPLIVFEKEIPDAKLITAADLLKNYDEKSMKDGMSETKDFSDFYYRGMNIENLISLTTIYINEEFGEFLSNEEPDIPSPFPRSTVDNWQIKEEIFNDTKKYIVNTLEKI